MLLNAMDLSQLIDELSRASAYGQGDQPVEVRQTHISIVFLVGSLVYKIKKPVNFGFLDFSSLEKRRHFCHEEVHLNRRLAPSVYLGVVPIVATPHGFRAEGIGEAIEWAVKMQRLPDEATIQERLCRGECSQSEVTFVAQRIARFHEAAAGGPHIARFGRFEVVAGNARENFAQSASHIDATVSRNVFERLRSRTEAELDRHQSLIERRAAAGVPRDTHGDLHLDHVYLFPQRPPPDDLVIIDCIEFNERFRFADPVTDMAFAAMDFAYLGHHQLAQTFGNAYFAARGDAEGRSLLPFYAAYRAIVRAKVEGMRATESEVPEAKRLESQARARAHWLLALSILESRDFKPILTLIGGLPGTGKSTLARLLAETHGFQVVRSDVIRKELCGVDPSASAKAEFGQGIYTSEQTERTYAECLRRAEQLLFSGQRVIVDASFSEQRQRRMFVELARRWCVPVVFFECQTSQEVVRERLQNRRGDASDADMRIYERASESWQAIGQEMRQIWHTLDTARPSQLVLAEATASFEPLLLSFN